MKLKRAFVAPRFISLITGTTSINFIQLIACICMKTSFFCSCKKGFRLILPDMVHVHCVK